MGCLRVAPSTATLSGLMVSVLSSRRGPGLWPFLHALVQFVLVFLSSSVLTDLDRQFSIIQEAL